MEDLKVVATSLKDNPNYIQCPRCRKFLRKAQVENNFDSLCDRCVRVLREGWYSGRWHDIPAVQEFAAHYCLRQDWIRGR
jgi:hypothetical protein